MNIAIGLYALLLFVGGLIGYFKANSHPSLIMGAITAIVFALLAFQKGRLTHYATLTLTGLMGIFFAYRFYMSHHFFPAGMMALVTAVLFLWLLCPFRSFSSSTCFNKERK